jgi:hypothetical protein
MTTACQRDRRRKSLAAGAQGLRFGPEVTTIAHLMSEFFLAVGGVAVASVTAVYSAIIDGDKSARQKWILIIVTIFGLGLGVLGAWDQKEGSDEAQAARDKAQTALTDLQDRVGTLHGIDSDIRARSEDLTKLNLLGGPKYYVVLGTYPASLAGNHDFNRVLSEIKGFFPDAENNGMIWKHPLSDGQYEMGFGRNLSPAAAEVYLRLAEYLAPEQRPRMRLEH